MQYPGYASRTRAGSVVGGDLFDLIAIDEERTGILFGDITGHGIGASILMTAVLSHLHVTLAHGGDPAAAVCEVNKYLTDHSSDRMFATLWVGVFDASTNVLSYVDAGHGHWMIARGRGVPTCPPTPRGMMIGVLPDFDYTADELSLKPGDRLILYSDGLVEQPSATGERFDDERLSAVIASSDSIEGDVTGAFAALEEFTGSNRFADDTTIASIEVLR